MEHVVTTRIVSEPDPGEYYSREACTAVLLYQMLISFSFNPAATELMHVLWKG